MDILELEKKYWQGMEDHDFSVVKSLTHFPCITAGRDGVRLVDEASFKKMFDAGENRKWKVLDISDVQTDTFDSSAVIAYLIRLETTKDGQTRSMQCACTSAWIRENDQWLCAMHSESDLKILNG